MIDLKVGDSVRCVADDVGFLTLNKIYKVTEVIPTEISFVGLINDVGTEAFYYSSRFVKVTTDIVDLQALSEKLDRMIDESIRQTEAAMQLRMEFEACQKSHSS